MLNAKEMHKDTERLVRADGISQFVQLGLQKLPSHL